MGDLSKRQRHCLVALLEHEEERHPSATTTQSLYAGEIARRLGFRHGPRQRGNGAKDGRSFTGHGGAGKWVTSALLGLQHRGLIVRYHPPYGENVRMAENYLTDDGRRAARALRDEGWTAREVEQ